MRVTGVVKEYVRKVVLEKVAGKIAAAESAKAAAVAARDAKVEEARKLCEKICAEAQAKFVKEVKKNLGLTFIPDSYDWDGKIEKGGSTAVKDAVFHDSFAETLTSRNNAKAKCNPSEIRDEFNRIADEPDRLRKAAASAADKLLFELELGKGKAAKQEFDKLLNELEVEI